MSELIKSIETIEYIDTYPPYSPDSLSPVEIKELMIQNKILERRQRYENCTETLNENLFYKLRTKTFLNFDPLNTNSEYTNDNGIRKKNTKSYRNCFHWDNERLEKELPLEDEKEEEKIIEFLNPPKDITNEQAEDLLKDNPNTLVSAMTLLAHNYMMNVEKIIQNPRFRQLDTPSHFDNQPRFLFTGEEETIFFTGRAMLTELNKAYKSEYVRELIGEIKGIITIFNQGLVGSIALKYNAYEDHNELMQVGNLGLLKALKKYQIDRNIKFSTYATSWVRQTITRHLADNSSTVRIPVHMHDSVNRFVKAKRHLESLSEDSVTIDDTIQYCNEMGIKIPSDKEILENVLNQRNMISLDKDFKDEDDSENLMDIISDDSQSVEQKVFKSFLEEEIDEIIELADLNFRQLRVLKLRSGKIPNENNLKDGTHTLEETGKKMGITRERVRQIESNAKKKVALAAKRLDKEWGI